MAGKGKAAANLIKYGPLAAAAAQRWGPVVWEQVKHQREPAEKFVQAKVARGNQRKKALTHATTVIDGSVLQVFHEHTAHWVVFSGEDPIAVHPPTSATFEELLDRADLGNRVTPRDTAVTIRVPKPRRRQGGQHPGATRAPHEEDPTPRPHTNSAPLAPGPVVRGEVRDGRPPPPA